MHISGPINGKFIAAFSVTGAMNIAPFAKITTCRPGYVWDGTPRSNWMSAGPFLEPVTALAIIIDLAARAVDEGCAP
jgi:hypothetical protein